MHEKINQINLLMQSASNDELEQVINLLNKTKINTNKIVNEESSYKLLQSVMDSKIGDINKGFFKTFASIGVTNENYLKSIELDNLDENIFSIKNYEKNYKSWLGKKLFLTKEEIEEKSVEDIDNKANKYLNLGVKHIDTFLRQFDGKYRKKLKSVYFEEIHNLDDNKSVFDLLKQWFNFKKQEKVIIAKIENLDKKSEDYKFMQGKFKNAINELHKGMYEVQRLLGISLLYIDREKNHNYQHIPEDQDFLIKQFSKIISKKIEFISQKAIPSKPVYHITLEREYYWKKSNNNNNNNNINKYELVSQKGDGVNCMKLNSTIIEGKSRDHKNISYNVDILHMGARIQKDQFSAVDKYIRKGLSSFNEILDNKGFMFVVNDFKEGNKLLKIIENQLGTLRTSWEEEPGYMQEEGNSFTNSNYNCIKGVIKIPYKGKNIKKFYDLLDKSLKENKNENEELSTLFKDFKNKFRNKEYNIEVEIQIFDIENYIKAEIDKSSPAYHGYYKRRQRIRSIPLYFPSKIYGKDLIKNMIKENLERIDEDMKKFEK